MAESLSINTVTWQIAREAILNNQRRESFRSCAGSYGSMSVSGSAGPGFDSRRGSKILFENFQPRV